jgi:DNA-binding IclR family transcriptional regulator
MKYLIAAHPIQQAILDVAAGKGIDDLSLREVARVAGLPRSTSPQKVKHHVSQMVKYGFLDIVGGRYRVGSRLKRSGK